jgi:hypothetical protein
MRERRTYTVISHAVPKDPIRRAIERAFAGRRNLLPS